MRLQAAPTDLKRGAGLVRLSAPYRLRFFYFGPQAWPGFSYIPGFGDLINQKGKIHRPPPTIPQGLRGAICPAFQRWYGRPWRFIGVRRGQATHFPWQWPCVVYVPWCVYTKAHTKPSRGLACFSTERHHGTRDNWT